jgi:hypothetical protein
MRTTVATGLIVAFIATGLYVGFTRQEAYPFSTFPMFSAARDGAYRRENYEVFGVSAGGRVTRAASPLGDSLAAAWIRDAGGNPKRLRRVGDLMLAYNRRRSPELELEAVRVVKTTYRIPAEPSRKRPSKSDSEIVYETGR